MGGCRCSFRDCENGTASRKELHYFRFPVRDPERLKEWARLANRMEFLELPKDKLVNKVVCQEHFERNMFMNYLCDKLSRLAIPRLMPQPDSSVLNVDTGDILWMEEDNGAIESEADACNQSAVLYPSPSPSQKSQLNIESVEALQNWKEPSPEPSRKKIKILNSESLVFGKSETPHKVIRFTASPNNSDLLLRKVPRVAELRKVCPPQLKLAGTTQIDLQHDSETHTLLEIEEDENMETTAYEQSKTQSVSPLTPGTGNAIATSKSSATPPAPKPVPVIDPVLVEKLKQSNSEIAQLKQMVQELLDRPPPKPQQVNVVQPSAVAQKVVMEKGPQLTKAQLFSSIKRYLNPTMVTLLRMELFSGSAERQWKPDEKSLAVDLLDIDEKVYDHFTEEFRFRLPPKAQVKEWKESGEIDADDAC
uniref:THAP-type domain-containing protein n=1 Tax=Anopheles atroparvus TaxID=41427 RepID=A0AAG5CP21_ANOAO